MTVMGCDEATLARMMRNRAEHPGDYWSNRIIDTMTRATDFDAREWGFDPVAWLADERAQMARQATGHRGCV